MNKLRAARAKGFDIAQPSLTEYKLHMEFELYRELEESKIKEFEILYTNEILLLQFLL